MLLCVVCVFLIIQIERVEGIILREDVRAFANSVEYAIDASEDAQALQRYVTALASSPYIETILVANLSVGEVLASSQRKWLGKSIEDVDHSLIRLHLPDLSQRAYGSTIFRADENLIASAKRIRLERLGTSEGFLIQDGAIAIAYRINAVAEEARSVELNAILWNTVILAIIASISIWIIYWRVEKPIRSIIQGVESRSRNDDFRIPAKLAKDEIGALASYLERAFAQERESRDNEMQARKAAEDAAKAKTQFLATMSHEIRTPMNGLIGTLHLMEDSISAENRSYLKTALQCSEDLLVLINDILDITKLDAGKVQIEQRFFDVGELIENTCALQYGRAAEKELEIVPVIDSNPDANIAYGDSHRIGQVISNLLSNAIKFTERGHIRVAMNFIEDAESRRSLRIEVIDTGIGIPFHAQTEIFESFSQADSTTTRKFGGTGLGLAICRGLASAMNGEIGLESEEGKGSVFWIQIPQDKSPTPEKRESPAKGPSKRILLIDRSAAVRHQAKQHLAYLGHSCVEAGSFKEAKETENGNTSSVYDFILIDERLFSEEFEDWLHSRLKSQDRDGRQIVLLRSTQMDTQESDRYRLIDKPIRFRELERILKEHGGERSHQKPKNNYRQYPKARLLVVDDNATNRMIAQSLLKRNHGIESATGNDGSVAITMAGESQYDLIFMDCMMPNIDGYKGTESIRAGAAGPLNQETPIIALTADAMDGAKEKCLAAGMNDYLPKPMNPKALAEALDNWIGDPETKTSSLADDHGTESNGLIDLSGLTEALGGNASLLRETVETFKSSLSRSMSEIESAISSSPDMDQLRMIVHSIRGEAYNFGVASFVQEAEQVEAALINSENEKALERIPEMMGIASDIIQEFERNGY